MTKINNGATADNVNRFGHYLYSNEPYDYRKHAGHAVEYLYKNYSPIHKWSSKNEYTGKWLIHPTIEIKPPFNKGPKY